MHTEQHISEGYKQTSIGIIPEDWEVKKLANILSQDRLGGNYENSESNRGFPVIKMGNLNRGSINLDKVQCLPENIIYDKKDVLKYGDLLFNTRNTLDLVGKVAVWRDELPFALYNSNLLKLEFNGDLVYSNFFMNYQFNSHFILSKLRGLATGTTSVAAIYSRDLKNLKIPLPPLPEQQKIAEILSAWDKAIELCQKTIEVLKQRNKGLAQQLLSGKTRVKGFENSVWKTVKLGEIGKVTSNGVDKKIVEDEIPVRLLNYLDVYRRNYLYSNEISHTVTTKQQKALNCDVKKGDVFLTPSSEVRNDIAVSAVAMEDFENTVYSYHVVRFRFNQEMDLQFKAHIFKTDLFFRQAQRICEGSGTRYVVSQEYFRNISISIPELEEQKQIGNILFNADKELKHYEEKLTNLKLQKKGLMQQLLTGKVRVKI